MDEFYKRMLRGYGLLVENAPMSPAGRMLSSLNRAENAIRSSTDISEEMHAALRRCQIRSKWPTWDHKTGAPTC